MSVLRKRSPWAIPIAGLLLGALSLGLAGCGGDDNNNGGGGGTTIPTDVPAPITQTATQPTPVVAGQGATITGASPVDPNLFGGVTDVTAIIPPGVLAQDGTLGIELVPTSQGVITQAQQAGQTGFPEVVAEINFGQITAGTNQIDPSRPIVFNGNTSLNIGLNPARYSRLNQLLNSGQCVLRAYRLILASGARRASLVPATGCNASLQAVAGPGNVTRGRIILSGSCSGYIIVFCVPLHQQGNVG